MSNYSPRPSSHSVLPLITWTLNSHVGGAQSPTSLQRSLTPARSRFTEEHSSREWIRRVEDQTDDLLESMKEPLANEVWKDRRLHRIMEDHLHSVNMALKTLRNELENLEMQIHNRNVQDFNSNNTVKSLELQQAGYVTDLRNRVGRCDVSLNVLSNDLRKLAMSVNTVGQQEASHYNNNSQALQHMQTKISKLEVDMIEHQKLQNEITNAADKQVHETVTALDFKTRNLLREIQQEIASLKTKQETKRTHFQREVVATLEVAQSQNVQLQNQAEKKFLDQLNIMQLRLAKMEAAQDAFIEGQEKTHQQLRSQVSTRLEAIEQKLTRVVRVNIQDSKKNTETGLAKMKENTEVMQKMLEGKIKLSEKNLRQEISRMKKLVLLT